jgi:MoaA/NifB/PqqE/SkfB family radical SAM enzyme/Tfp pilus assembly protein PilF
MENDLYLSLEKAKKYICKQDYPAAISELKKVIMSEAKNSEVHFELGKVFYLQENISDAIKEFKLTIDLDSTNVHARILLAKAYRSKEEFDLAIREYKKILELGHESAEIYRELGHIYGAKKDFERSVRNFQKAVKFEPGNYCTHYALARYYLKIMEFDLAIDEFRKGLKINPALQSNEEIGNAYAETGEYDLALEHYRRLGPSDVAHDDRIVELSYKKFVKGISDKRYFNVKPTSSSCGKLYTQKLEELENACKIDYENVDNCIRLARLYNAVGKRQRAFGMLKRGMSLACNKNNRMLKNKILNEIEIIQGKLIIKSKPRFLHVTITNKCNIRCIMCVQPKTPIWDITPELANEIIRCMPYLQQITWQGGEVFLSKHFRKLFDRASGYANIKQLVFTNGQLINEDWARKLTRNNASLSLSIDGVTKRTYEDIRRGGSFERLLNNIALINKYRDKNMKKDPIAARSSLSLGYVVMKRNYNEIEKVLDFAYKYGFNNICFSAVDTITSEENIFFHKDMKILSVIEQKIRQAQQKAKEYNICVFNAIPPVQVFDGKATGNIKTDMGEKNVSYSSGVCYAPWQSLYIESSIVRPRCYCAKSMDRDKLNSLEKIWNSKLMQSYRKNVLCNKHDWCNHLCVSGAVPEQWLKSV